MVGHCTSWVEALNLYKAMGSRDRILKYLRKRKGEWVSGESLSEGLEISRAAVCKHIRTLRKEGYDIGSSTGKGYILKEIPDLLLPREILEGLDTAVMGRREIFYSSRIDSTNTKAKKIAEEGAGEGTLVVSESQTSGRGRRGRTWFSPPGQGIYSSLILRPEITPSQAPKITLLTAVVMAETLLSLTGLKINIKWPNDILVNRGKLAGILTEISADMHAIDYVVVGMGLNVNTMSFPEGLANIATSILIETGRPYIRVPIIREYLKRFESYYDIFKKDGFATIISRWREIADIIGRSITVDTTGGRHTGEIQDIDDNGVLILKDGKGDFHRIFSGDIILNRGN